MAKRIPGDWYPGCLPRNIERGEGAYIESAFTFRRFFSERVPGLRLGGHSALYTGCTLAVGKNGFVSLGEYSLITGAYLACQMRIEIGSRVLISWNAGIFDSVDFPRDVNGRAKFLKSAASDAFGCLPQGTRKPVVIEDDVWIGFGSVIFPGVRIGAGSVIGAKSVVKGNIPAGVLAAGNPVRVIREL